MRLEKGKISSSQLIFLIAAFMQGTTYVTTFTFLNAPRDEWLAVLISYAVFIPFALMYLNLSAKFPNDNLIQIHDKVYGKMLGRTISIIYLLYFIFTCAGTMRYYSAYIVNVFMPETPLLVLALFLIILCVWAAKEGIETMARLGLLATALMLGSFVIYFLLLLNRIELTHFFPVMDVPPIKVLQNVNIISSEYLGEAFIITMILPCVSDKENIKKNYLIGTAVGTFSMFLIAIMVTGVLGNTAGIFTGPLIQATRNIQVLNINIRTEFILMGFLTISNFFKSSVLLYVIALSLGYIFKLKSYKFFIVPAALLVYSLLMFFSENVTRMAEIGGNVWALISLLMLNILPVITLITASAKGLPQKQGGDGS